MIHYTYLLMDSDSDKMYIGVRSYKGNPNKDPYMGSSKLMTTEEKRRCDKIVLSTFKTRKEAAQHEVELHELHDVGVNPMFWNGCKSTTTKFSMQGIKRGPFSEAHVDKMKVIRNNPDGPYMWKKTKYLWVHKDGEEFEGTVHDVVKHCGKDSSSFYKVINGKLLYASGWRIKKNLANGIETSDFAKYYRKCLSAESKKALSAAQRARKKKYPTRYMWADYFGNTRVETLYAMANEYAKGTAKFTSTVNGKRNFAHGWRIVANADSKCVTSDLNFGRAIKQQLNGVVV